jgi:hypothetical protein
MQSTDYFITIFILFRGHWVIHCAAIVARNLQLLRVSSVIYVRWLSKSLYRRLLPLDPRHFRSTVPIVVYFQYSHCISHTLFYKWLVYPAFSQSDYHPLISPSANHLKTTSNTDEFGWITDRLQTTHTPQRAWSLTTEKTKEQWMWWVQSPRNCTVCQSIATPNTRHNKNTQHHPVSKAPQMITIALRFNYPIQSDRYDMSYYATRVCV